jgi:sulfur relay (sulfurtransferase) DsrC/TusE family protein
MKLFLGIVLILGAAYAAYDLIFKKTSAVLLPQTQYAAKVNVIEAEVLFPGDPAKQALAVAGKLPVATAS